MFSSVVFCVALSSFLANAIQFAPKVRLQSGEARGLLTTLPSGDVVRKYLGVPYAKADRFELPVSPKHWTGIRNMTSFGKVCWQGLIEESSLLFAGISGDADMSEDCLNLNVFVPHKSKAKNLPVMLWIHGGSSIIGSNRVFDGSYLATIGDVIVVAINYRLGALGFVATGKHHGDLKGNYGMYDQIEALKWVKHNIARFGGDPHKVTIFGQSAGGVSVSLLCLSPMANGLFKNAIIQSGVGNSDWGDAVTYNESIRFSRAGFTDCPDIGKLKACLKTKQPKQIVHAYPPSNRHVIDGKLLPDAPLVLLKEGRFLSRNILLGVTDDEGSGFSNAIPELSKGLDFDAAGDRKYWITGVQHYTHIFLIAKQPPVLEAAIQRYTYWANLTDPFKSRRMYLDFTSDYMMTAPSIEYANDFSKNRHGTTTSTYFYQLEYAVKQGVSPRYFTVPPLIKTYHGADVFIIFGYALNVSSNLQYTKDANFSRAMIQLWTNFAKTGNPNNPGSVSWPEYDLQKQQYLALKPNMQVKSQLRADHMAFWNDFLPDFKRVLPKPCVTGNSTTKSYKDNDVALKVVQIESEAFPSNLFFLD